MEKSHVLFFLLIILCMDYVNASTIDAVSCQLNDVKTAIQSAGEGDTVNIPAGTCPWNSGITVSKPLSIIGSGSGNGGTKLISSANLNDGFFFLTGFESSKLMRISNMNFNVPEGLAINIQNDISLSALRIDHNEFHFGYTQIGVTGSKGVIDHNTFYNGIQIISFSAGSNNQAYASWDSLAAGTSDALFIEDNTFITDADYKLSYTQEQIGTYNGGKLVIRHNEFNGDNIPISDPYLPFMAHGSADGGCDGAGYWESSSCQRRGQSVIEYYDNTVHGKRVDFLYISRGSANIVYGNSITGTVMHNPRILFQEEEYYSDNWAIHRTSWPAEDQVHNTFVWNNIYRGHDFNEGVYGYVESDPNANAGLLKDRDFFLHAPCERTAITDMFGNPCTHGKATFTGANGASGSYPTDGTKYPNKGTMVFQANTDNEYLGYVPYTYPHPLTIGTCAPTCTGKTCGDDGCGGTCGTCKAGDTCSAQGQCIASCTPSCTGKTCGDNGCGGTCGTCQAGYTCNTQGQCTATCTPSCTGKTCGDNGCGGSCGTCQSGLSCTNFKCVSPCTPSWQCTSWSGCQTNQQTRSCTDINSCGTTNRKPSESQACGISKIEAESVTITAPFQIVSDSAVSGSKYVLSGGEAGTIQYTFAIDKSGVYKIVGHAFADDKASDSFSYSIDGSPVDIWDLNPLGLASEYGNWRDDEITKRGTGDSTTPQFDPFIFFLNSGTHSLNILGREQGTKLDYFYLSLVSQCAHDSDNNCDGCITQDELLQHIQKWKGGQVTLSGIMEAIMHWRNGC